jgi:membrane protease YdiL (CAAX protease family)
VNEVSKDSITNVPWRPVDAVLVFVLSWLGLPILILLGIRQLAPFVPIAHTLLEMFRTGDIVASFVFAVADAVLALGLMAIFVHRYHARWRDLGWRRSGIIWSLAYVVAAFFAFIILVQVAFVVVQFLFPQFNAAQKQSNEFLGATSATSKRLALVALVILPPIVEETVFRGFIFPAFSKRYGTIAGAIISSILFGFAHLQYNISVYTIVLGLILCFMYVKLRSIFPGMALHMLNNYIAYLALVGK